MTWQARALEDYQSFARNTVRVVVWRNHGERTEFLGGNGQSVLVEPGIDPEDVGLVIPRDALGAIAAELAKHLGDALPSAGEVRVLREWLAVERDRTNVTLSRFGVAP